MLNMTRAGLTAALILALTGLAASAAQPPSKGGGGSIVCWKDKSGKIVGCGDSVPPEYQTSATKELDSRGVTRKTTDTAEEVAKRKEREQELAKQKADEKKRLTEQRRQDAALLNTFSSEKEIDAKRDRDLADIDLQLGQMQVSLKAVTARYNDAKSRNAKEDMARATAEKNKIEQNIAAKDKEKEEIHQKYGAQKQRFVELKGGTRSAAGPAPAPSTAPKK